jgi:hypothetical protein
MFSNSLVQFSQKSCEFKFLKIPLKANFCDLFTFEKEKQECLLRCFFRKKSYVCQFTAEALQSESQVGCQQETFFPANKISTSVCFILLTKVLLFSCLSFPAERKIN